MDRKIEGKKEEIDTRKEEQNNIKEEGQKDRRTEGQKDRMIERQSQYNIYQFQYGLRNNEGTVPEQSTII
jgi:hypothetical protein